MTPAAAPKNESSNPSVIKLPDDAGAARADRQPHRDLPLACRGACQQQVRNVRAGDQKQQTNHCHQHHQRLPEPPS